MSNPDPIRQRIELDADTQGAEDTKRALDEMKGATREAGDETRAIGQASEESAKKQGLLSRATLGVSGAITGLVAGLAGSVGIVSLYQEWIATIETATQRLREQIDVVRELAEARLNFVALQGIEDPQTLRELEASAAIAGRDPGEVFRLAGVFQSQFANESPETIQSLIRETAVAGQLTDAPLTELGRGLSAIFRRTGDARVASNIFQQAIQQAGEEDPGRLAEEIGKFITIGENVGGLSTGESAGFAAAGTALGLPNEVATTGLRNLITRIRDVDATTPGSEILNELGIDRSNIRTAFTQIAAARSAGQITDSQLISIGGQEAIGLFSALSEQTVLDEFNTNVDLVAAAADFDGSIASDKSASLFTPDSIQGLNLLAKQAESATTSIRGRDQNAARASAGRAILARELALFEASGDINPADVTVILEEYDKLVANGRSPARAATLAGNLRAGEVNVRVPFVGEKVGLLNPAIVLGEGAERFDFGQGVEQGFNLGPLIPGQRPSDEASSPTIIQNQTINNGTQFIGAGDPAVDDLDGRDRE